MGEGGSRGRAAVGVRRGDGRGGRGERAAYEMFDAVDVVREGQVRDPSQGDEHHQRSEVEVASREPADDPEDGYLAGRLIGGRRLAPKLSPGKTWAGAGGGLVFSIVTGLAVAMWFNATPTGQFRAEGLAALLSVVAQGGDLMESALKRQSGRKDSGQLIPGHGGILDRVDGLLGAAVAALLWQLLAHHATLGAELWR